MKVIGLHRRLAAIMFTDMVGYSALTEGNEQLSLELLEEHRAVLRGRVSEFGGREIKSTGDGLLIEFGSVVDAVHCAIQTQTALYERNLTVPDERKVRIRIGIHLGDIVDSEKDAHGNGVNIAARIEPFAIPGSIAISQSVFEQVRGHVNLPIRKVGRLALKNIEAPPEVYRVVLPWEATGGLALLKPGRAIVRRFVKALRSPANASLGATVAGAFLVAGLILGGVFLGPRPVSEGSAVAPEILPNRWEIALGTKIEAGAVWHPFDPAHAVDYVDQVEGAYLLRLKFPVEKTFAHPALLLGLISDRHEAFLNGHFVGGARVFSELVSYNIGAALSSNGENELVIRAETRPTLTPGLYVLPATPPELGEFAEISARVDDHRLAVEILQPIYLVISLLVAFASFFYAAVRGRRNHFYAALFLAMGALGVAFYNSTVMQVLDYRAYRFLNLISFAGSALALVSYDLAGRGKRSYEVRNNLAGIGFVALAAVTLLAGAVRPSAYLFRLEVLFGVVALYAGSAVVGFWRRDTKRDFFDAALVRVFGGLIFAVVGAVVLAKASVLGWSTPKPTASVYGHVRQIAVLTPLFFALAAFGRALVDYVRKSNEIAYKQRKDDLILSLSSVIARSTDFPETVRTVQGRVADFLGASRSTIYLLDDSGKTLRAEFLHGSSAIRSAVGDTVSAEGGIIGYCLKTEAPVWVEDIGRDERFRAEFQARDTAEARTYRTGSFIVAPILIGRKVLGVITIADRKDGLSFTAEDFCLMHLASRDLSLLVSQLQANDSAAKLKLVA
jgi:adenylate cyclase